MNKKQLFLWALYDFANSIIYINFALYFSVWIVVDAGLSDFWYNSLFAFSTLFLLATAPFLAARVDRKGGRKLLLNIATVGTFIGYGLTAVLASNNSHVWYIALAFLVGLYFYQLAYVFLNPMLDEIADHAHRSRASGIGQLASSLGFVAGIAFAIPFASSRTGPLLPSVFAFLILALPMMIFFKETRKIDTIAPDLNLKTRRMAIFFTTSLATPMLVAFFFFNDALVSVSNNYSIYLERVFHTSDSTKSILLAIVLGMSAVGAIVGGWIGDKIGALKTIKFILIGWVILLPLIAVAQSLWILAVLTIITGFLLGSIWTVTRSYLSVVLPKEDMNYGFSFYAIMERFATLIGPLTWGGIIWYMGTEPIAYRTAMAVMTIFVFVGLIILMSWKKLKVPIV